MTRLKWLNKKKKSLKKIINKLLPSKKIYNINMKQWERFNVTDAMKGDSHYLTIGQASLSKNLLNALCLT